MIRVAVGCGDGQPTVVVEDNGIGIPDTEQAKVMEPFVSLQTESAGSGLGLSIVADIARQHKGRLSARPGRNGKGSRFELSLAPVPA